MLFGLSCGSTCGARDPTTDTVKVAMPPPVMEEAYVTADVDENEQRRLQEHQEQEEQERLAAEQEADRVIRLKQAATERLQQEQEAALRAEEERVGAELAAQREREEAQAAAVEAARQAEIAAEAAQQRLAQVRKEAVRKFLADNNFKGVNEGKKSLTKTTYALHEAAKRNNIAMVNMLVEEGASVDQTNSRKQTALQRAMREDKNNSHKEIIDLLKGLTTNRNSRTGGA